MKNILLSGLVASSLVLGSLNADSSGLNDGKVISSIKFFDIVKKTKPNQVASNFGKPDEIVVMKTPSGAVAGVVWVYRDAVLKQHGMMDARFTLVNGQMKYVSLSDSVI